MLHLLIKEIVVHEDVTEDGRNTTVEIHFNFLKPLQTLKASAKCTWYLYFVLRPLTSTPGMKGFEAQGIFEVPERIFLGPPHMVQVLEILKIEFTFRKVCDDVLETSGRNLKPDNPQGDIILDAAVIYVVHGTAWHICLYRPGRSGRECFFFDWVLVRMRPSRLSLPRIRITECGIRIPSSAKLDNEVGEPSVKDGVKGIDMDLVKSPCGLSVRLKESVGIVRVAKDINCRTITRNELIFSVIEFLRKPAVEHIKKVSQGISCQFPALLIECRFRGCICGVDWSYSPNGFYDFFFFTFRSGNSTHISITILCNFSLSSSMVHGNISFAPS